MKNVIKRFKRWYRRTLQLYRDIYSMEHAKNRKEKKKTKLKSYD